MCDPGAYDLGATAAWEEHQKEVRDLRAEIERLRAENAALRHDLDRALANHAADLT